MKKILANDGIDAKGKQLLETAGFEVITEKVDQAALADAINNHGYVALTVRSATQVRAALIDVCPNLKVIGRGGVGMDNIDVDYAKSKGIAVINTPAASSHSVAELVFAHLFTGVRFLHDANRRMPAEGDTAFAALKKNYGAGSELRGKTIGIIGFGHIGQAVASIALGLGMKVIAHDPFLANADVVITIEGAAAPVIVNVVTIPMDDVLKAADFLTLHVPGGQMLGAAELASMKKGAFIVNAARGGVVNEDDLLAALNSGHIAFAGLDVFNNEPTPRKDILAHPKISLTPHIGAATDEAQERIGVELAERIIAALA
ncbi:MAG: NAD(P)-dependent oxidoreductase [Bacteroidia bacterium]